MKRLLVRNEAAALLFLFLSACTDDGPASTGEGDGDGDGDGADCETIHDCALECDDDPCEADCRDMGSPAAREEWDAVDACYEANAVMGPGDAAEHCPSELAACFADDTGSLDCPGLVACSDSCAEDETCEDACFDDGTAQAQEEWLQLAFCLVEVCPDFESACVQQAVMDVCADQAAPCL